jgi:hypothetical protein
MSVTRYLFCRKMPVRFAAFLWPVLRQNGERFAA